MVSFPWESSSGPLTQTTQRDRSVFVKSRELRHGCLYRCRVCDAPWYLFGQPEIMHAVPNERLDLISKWNEHPQLLSDEFKTILQSIGRTPPDRYGNGREFNETPCCVETVHGETIERAVVSLQQHAPIEDWRNYRLASEIARIKPSASALPLAVRIATSQAEEVSMGFAPTYIESPEKEILTLNWTQHFLVKPGWDANKVALSRKAVDTQSPPVIYNGTEGIVYFVADEDLPIH